MRILFITANRVGDAVLTTGLLDHLIRQYPGCRITVACGPVAEGVFTRMPNLERLIVFAKQPWSAHWLGLWRQVAFTRWDLVVDLRGSALSYLVTARRRAVMRRLAGRKHEQFAAVLGVSPAPLPVVWTGPADHARAAALLPAGRVIVGLGPTANWAGKAWPAERFAALFHALAAGKLPGAVPLILAGPGPEERALAAPWARTRPPCPAWQHKARRWGSQRRRRGASGRNHCRYRPHSAAGRPPPRGARAVRWCRSRRPR